MAGDGNPARSGHRLEVGLAIGQARSPAPIAGQCLESAVGRRDLGTDHQALRFSDGWLHGRHHDDEISTSFLLPQLAAGTPTIARPVNRSLAHSACRRVVGASAATLLRVCAGDVPMCSPQSLFRQQGCNQAWLVGDLYDKARPHPKLAATGRAPDPQLRGQFVQTVYRWAVGDLGTIR